ncbi:hypothetical protein [Aeromicrobium wangtongii]|uniref:hypothetical protein n=1 Tax=Aeromicrobium wangtongii TaxID=2969247 RepID=UPI002017E762|nr:hypothetical protein [Aeromicrobium wangtongii]MCL3817305.1 hypothetical protein [Aeromicrobium wangtongii]
MSADVLDTPDGPRLFVVTVALRADGARADLMTMAAVLHRRGVEVVAAELGRPAHGRRVFSARFVAAPRQASTVVRSFENLVDVVDTSLFAALDTRVHALSAG